MTTKLNLRATAITLFIALEVSYILCIVGGLLFSWVMYQAWQPLLPGFTWPLTPGGFIVGLIWLALYSVYVAVLIVLPYNHLTRHITA